MRFFPLAAVLLALPACGPVALFPAPVFMRNFPPEGPPNYQQGMIDGCRTALGAVGNSSWSIFHRGIHYDVDKAINDQVYYKAWKDAYFYCKYEHDIGPE